MRTHLNVAAKLELQTQEKMYESRLHHLENVLEGNVLKYVYKIFQSTYNVWKKVSIISSTCIDFFLLSEMKQREGHFLHLAEETAALKDQVDALRELSVITLKSDNSIMDNGVSRNGGMSDKEAKAHAAAGNIRLHIF